MSMFGNARNYILRVSVVGETANLDRKLKHTEGNLKRFGHTVEGVAKGQGFATLFEGRGFAAFAGGGAVALGLERIIETATDMQMVLGQTQVAVENVGLTWSTEGSKIQAAAEEIAKASGFSPDEVLRSFQIFLRGSKNVDVALERTQLAAQVARKNYRDLGSSTMVVNKASMGLIGPMRRLGYQIDKNATSVQALTYLANDSAGSLEAFGNTAAGSQAKAQVAMHEAEVSLGENLTPAVVALSGAVQVAADDVSVLSKALHEIAATKIPVIEIPIKVVMDAGGSSGIGGFLKKFAGLAWMSPAAAYGFAGKAIYDALFGGGGGAISGVGEHNAGGVYRSAAVDSSMPGTPKPGVKLTREQALNIAQSRSALTSALGDDLSAANALAAFYKERAAQLKGKKGYYDAQMKYLEAMQQVASIEQQMADQTAKAAQDLKDKADAMKSAVLDALDRRSSGLHTKWDIADAKAALKLARRIGGPEGIKLAQRDLTDAMLARERFLAENASYTAGKGGSFVVQIGNMTVNGVKNVRELIAALEREARKTSAQSRGRTPGHKPGMAGGY